MLHLVGKKNEVSRGVRELEVFTAECRERLGTKVPMYTSVKLGKILSMIGETAQTMEAALVVIGTHGLQGKEYIIGAHAVRIIGSA